MTWNEHEYDDEKSLVQPTKHPEDCSIHSNEYDEVDVNPSTTDAANEVDLRSTGSRLIEANVIIKHSGDCNPNADDPPSDPNERTPIDHDDSLERKRLRARDGGRRQSDDDDLPVDMNQFNEVDSDKNVDMN